MNGCVVCPLCVHVALRVSFNVRVAFRKPFIFEDGEGVDVVFWDGYCCFPVVLFRAEFV